MMMNKFVPIIMFYQQPKWNILDGKIFVRSAGLIITN